MVRSTAGLSFAGYGEAIIDDNAQGKGVLAAAWRGGKQQRSRQTSGVRISTHVNVN